MTDELAPLTTWRSAIADKHSGLESTTRLVALTLSLHMSERGSAAMPGHGELSDETDLHPNTVQAHLAKLLETKWLVVERPAVQGRGMKNKYQASIPRRPLEDGPSAPEKAPPGRPFLPRRPLEDGPSAGKAPSGRAFLKAPSEGPSFTEKNLEPLDLNPLMSRALDDARDSDQLSLTPEDTTDPSDSALALLELFWSRYPPRANRKLYKNKATEIWQRMTPAERQKAIAAVEHYAAYLEESGLGAADAFRWLRDKRWEDFADTAGTGPAKPSSRGNGHRPWRAPDPERYNDRRIG